MVDRDELLANLRERVKNQLESEQEVELGIEEVVVEKRPPRRLLPRRRLPKRQTTDSSELVGGAVRRAIPKALADRAEESSLRNVAAALILAGSILGIMTGLLLLTGNPQDILTSSLFQNTSKVDVSGQVLDIDGRPIEGALVVIQSLDGETELRRGETDDLGRFLLKEVVVDESKLVATHAEHGSVVVIFIPDQAQQHLLTLPDEVEGESIIDLRSASGLPLAVQLGAIVAAITLASAAVGVLAAHEARRGKRYRRTMVLSTLGLFSRGLIVIGPTLIILGMGLLMLSKKQFLDQEQDMEA